MPAVTPARRPHVAVAHGRSGRRRRASAGYSSASWSARAQCVVTVRPSSSPASAARNAPVHTVASRRTAAAAGAIQPTSSSASARARVDALAAGEQQRVDRAVGGPGSGSADSSQAALGREPRRRATPATRRSRRRAARRATAVVGSGEHLVRPDGVEWLQPAKATITTSPGQPDRSRSARSARPMLDRIAAAWRQ